MRWFLAVLALIGVQAHAQDPAAAFMAQQGCAIGPETRALAQDQGITPEQIDALIAADSAAVTRGDWTVLSAQACQIVVPQITSPIACGDVSRNDINVPTPLLFYLSDSI